MMTLRLATPEEAADLLAIYAPLVRETAISFELEPPDLDTFRRRIEQTLQRWPWLVCADATQVLGYAYAGAHRSRGAYQWSVETSAYVHAAHRGRRIGSALYESLLALLRLQGFYNAYAGICLPNPASVALHEGLGFEPVGVYPHVGYKLGAWHDVGWWRFSLQDVGPGAPEPPMFLPAALSHARWQRALQQGRTRLP